jgi:hypothetical protein
MIMSKVKTSEHHNLHVLSPLLFPPLLNEIGLTSCPWCVMMDGWRNMGPNMEGAGRYTDDEKRDKKRTRNNEEIGGNSLDGIDVSLRLLKRHRDKISSSTNAANKHRVTSAVINDFGDSDNNHM